MTREYLMCPPQHFAVEYAINPWMDPAVEVDRELAGKQWELLRVTLTDLGHTVHVLPARAGLPDMVYAANGAFSVDGTVYGARFRHPAAPPPRPPPTTGSTSTAAGPTSRRARPTRERATSRTCPGWPAG